MTALPIRQIYDAVLMDHIKGARHFGHDAAADFSVEIDNPLCGDTMTVYLRMDAGEFVRRAGFSCECCGIAMASASIMTQALEGLTSARAIEHVNAFSDAIDQGSVEPIHGIDEAHTAVLLAVAAAPSRKMCAKLAWLGVARMLNAAQTVTEL